MVFLTVFSKIRGLLHVPGRNDPALKKWLLTESDWQWRQGCKEERMLQLQWLSFFPNISCWKLKQGNKFKNKESIIKAWLVTDITSNLLGCRVLPGKQNKAQKSFLFCFEVAWFRFLWLQQVRWHHRHLTKAYLLIFLWRHFLKLKFKITALF